MAKQPPSQPQPQQRQQPPSEPEANLPIHSIRHRSLKAAIWKNETDNGVIYNVTLTRSYRQDNVWHDSQSFSYDDLMNVAKLLFDAHSYITELRVKDAASNRAPAAPPARAAKQ